MEMKLQRGWAKMPMAFEKARKRPGLTDRKPININ
jgi:hypothetical protein